MGGVLRLLMLPIPLLNLLACAPAPALTQTPEWPYNLPAHVKYYPEHELLIKRDIEIQQKLQNRPVRAIKKMSDDAGEKFFLEYWSFEEEDWTKDSQQLSNQSFFSTLDSPVRVHREEAEDFPSSRIPRGLIFAAKSIFRKRDFQCPSGTLACTSIDRPNSCCSSGTTCQLIQDTGLGDVGCCPAGQTCAGSLSTCEDGYTSCPSNPGGGCCLPGYACFDVGCVLTSTATFVIASTSTPTPSTTTTTSTTTITPSTSNIPVIPPTTTTKTTTRIRTTTSLTTTCRTGYKSCAASLGGGCCPTDRACGSANCPASTTSGSVIPPVRPTTGVTTTTSTQTSKTTPGPSICPTGFYACSAYYEGGCCQIGRDCDKTSCPTSVSTTLLSSNGITAVAPTGSGITAPGTVLTGNCARGWSTCAQTEGGGCCPTGYSCGASCIATASGVSGGEVGKLAPNGVSSLNSMRAALMACLFCMASFGMTLLIEI